MIFYVWIWYTSMDIWYLKGAMQIAAKTTAPLQRLLQLVRNEPLKILKSLNRQFIGGSAPCCSRQPAQQPCASTRRENTWTSLALMKSAPWFSVYWLCHTMSLCGSDWLRSALAKIGPTPEWCWRPPWRWKSWCSCRWSTCWGPASLWETWIHTSYGVPVMFHIEWEHLQASSESL